MPNEATLLHFDSVSVGQDLSVCGSAAVSDTASALTANRNLTLEVATEQRRETYLLADEGSQQRGQCHLD